MTAVISSLREAPLIGASRLLAQRGLLGLVWLDRELSVTACYGALAGFVTPGEHVTESLLPFAGMEADLDALRLDPEAVLDIPSVTIVLERERTPRLNLAAVWSEGDDAIIIHISRAVHSADLEIELNRQVRARLIAEADVMAKSLELRQANADLEQFAAVISHDLKAPMRELRHLTEDAEAALSAGDMPGTQDMLHAMRRQSTRMSSMLTSLLSFASATRKVDALEIVDTAQLIQSVVSSLPTAPGHHVEVTGDWPRITTFSALLDLVLRNVVQNALDHHDRDDGRIAIDARHLDDEFLKISISDDGPGIMQADQQSIFLPFRTLSLTPDSPSRGMGLAIVARALATVGGHITIRSDAPKTRGTTFHIRWPKSPVTTSENCPTQDPNAFSLGT